jgi:ubiquitin-like protein Pup
MARIVRNATDLARREARTDATIFMAADEGAQKQKAKGGGGEEEADAKGEGGQKLAKKGDELKGEMDDLLDEIDNVLEENAEEFVKNYVQRGGQ